MSRHLKEIWSQVDWVCHLKPRLPECELAAVLHQSQRCVSDGYSWDTGRRSCFAPDREPAGTSATQEIKEEKSWPPVGRDVKRKGNIRTLYRHVDFFEHLCSPASVQQSDVLRCWDNNSTWKRHIHRGTQNMRGKKSLTWAFLTIKYVELLFFPDLQLGRSGWWTTGRLLSLEACPQLDSPRNPSLPANKQI